MRLTPLYNCGVRVNDVDLSSCGPDTMTELGNILKEHLVVIIKGQTLSPEQQLAVCEQIGDVEEFPDTKLCADDVNGVQRVCGKRDNEGEPTGLFPHNEVLDWHCNRPSATNRKPIVWLHAISGTSGSVTSWLDTTKAYDDMPTEWKAVIDPLTAIYGYEPNTYSHWSKWKAHRNMEGAPFVRTVGNKRGYLYPPHQIFGFKDVPDDEAKEILDFIDGHTMQEKYVYHHHWDDGDVLLGEQNVTIHKRQPVNNITDRLLHRITMDFEWCGG